MSHHPTPTPLPFHPYETKEPLVEWLTVAGKSENGETKTGPPRSFIIFRKWFIKFSLPLMLLSLGRPQETALKQSALSALVGVIWNILKELSQERILFWESLQKDVKAYHATRYPAFYTPEAQMKRAEAKREQQQKRKAQKSANAQPGGPGPKRSPKGTARSSPYPSPLAQPLPSPAFPASNLLPTHASTSLQTIHAPPTHVGAYPASIPAYRPRPVSHPAAVYGPPSSSSMAPSSSFAAPSSFNPPSATRHFSSPLPPSSFFAPPPSGPGSHYRQHAPHFSPAALPFPLTSSMPTTAMPSSSPMYPPQAQYQYQVPPRGYPSMASPHNAHAHGFDIDFGFATNSFEPPQANATLGGMQPLPVNNLFVGQMPEFEITETLLDIDFSGDVFL